MPRDLTQAEVLKRRMDHATKELKKEETASGVKNAAKLVGLYDSMPNTLTDPQTKVINVLTPDVKNIIIGYAFLALVEWAEAATKDSPKPQTAEQIKKACIERAMHMVEKDGLFDASVGTDTIHEVKPGGLIT